MLSEIQAQIRCCLRRCDDFELKRIFDSRKVRCKKHFLPGNQIQFQTPFMSIAAQVRSSTDMAKSGADKDVEGLGKEQLQEALRDVGRIVDDEFLDDIFKQYDSDGNGWVGLEEFKCSVRRRSKLEQWTASMPIGPLVASCFVPLLLRSYEESAHAHVAIEDDASRDTATTASSNQQQDAGTDDAHMKPEAALKMLSDPDPLSRIRRIDARDLTTVCIGLMDGFRELICERLVRLNEAYTAMERQSLKCTDAGSGAVGKFAFSMQGGETSDFYNGLGARVGPEPQYPLRVANLKHSAFGPFPRSVTGVWLLLLD